MCTLAIRDGQIDLDSCPLLAGLSPEERRRKAQDPRLQACMAKASSRLGAAEDQETCLTEEPIRTGRRSARRAQAAAQQGAPINL